VGFKTQLKINQRIIFFFLLKIKLNNFLDKISKKFRVKTLIFSILVSLFRFFSLFPLMIRMKDLHRVDVFASILLSFFEIYLAVKSKISKNNLLDRKAYEYLDLK
jgi:hypothetical protein